MPTQSKLIVLIYTVSRAKFMRNKVR